jgi:hypothetical protein
MILTFPCLKRDAAMIARYGPSMPFHPFQSRLSAYGVGLTFSEMVDFRVDQFTRSELSRDADLPVDLTYPNYDECRLSGIEEQEYITRCNQMMELIEA